MNKRDFRIKNKILVNVLIISLMMVGPIVLMANGIKPVNADNPGEKIELEKSIIEGKINIVDFYSEFCPPCVRIAPYLEELDKKDEGKVIVKVDINRKGVRGIDWRSPLARQFSLNSIPHFKIFDTEGKKIAEGRAAFSKILEYFKEAGISLR